jgi:hypothetical protein
MTLSAYLGAHDWAEHIHYFDVVKVATRLGGNGSVIPVKTGIKTGIQA